MPDAPWIVPDETGWRIGGRLAWMHGFVTARATVYHVFFGGQWPMALAGEAHEGVLPAWISWPAQAIVAAMMLVAIVGKARRQAKR